MFFGLFGLLFPNCVPQVVQDTGYDTGMEKTVWIDGITFSCDVTGWAYDVQAWTDSPSNAPDSGTVTMQLIEDGYYEEHPLPDPTWNDATLEWEYHLELSRVYATEDLVLGETTLMPCTDAESGMNWHIELVNDGTMDCAVFGTDPAAMGFTWCSVWTAA